MPKGRRRKRVQKFNYDKNRKMKWKRSKERLKIGCEQVKAAWDEEKSVRRNMEDMGLSYDPNKSIQALNSAKRPIKKSKKKKVSKVVEAMEVEANAPQEPGLRLAEPEVQFCGYMMDKYGEDFKAMARDYKNYYQHTPKQIRRRIMTFKSIPQQYQAYLAQKEAATSGT